MALAQIKPCWSEMSCNGHQAVRVLRMRQGKQKKKFNEFMQTTTSTQRNVSRQDVTDMNALD